MIDVGGLEKVTGKVVAWLSDRGRDGWWVCVAPWDKGPGRKVGNHFAEFGSYLTKSEAQIRLIEIKQELLKQGWIEGP